MAGQVTSYQDSPPKLLVQGLYDESLTALQRLGTVRCLDDGRTFAYARAGAVALAAGKLTQNAVVAANHLNIAVATAAAIDDTRVNVTLGATAAAANLYKDGFLHVNDAAGEGHLYKIRGHLAIVSAGTGYIELYDKLRVALTTLSEVTLTQSPQDGVLVFPISQTGAPAGVPPIAVTASYYFWNQVKGPCACLVDGVVVVGNDVAPGTVTAGALKAAATTDIVGAVGRVLRVNADTEYALIQLAVPGY